MNQGKSALNTHHRAPCLAECTSHSYSSSCPSAPCSRALDWRLSPHSSIIDFTFLPHIPLILLCSALPRDSSPPLPLFIATHCGSLRSLSAHSCSAFLDPLPPPPNNPIAEPCTTTVPRTAPAETLRRPGLLQQSLPGPLASENPFSEQECIDHIGGHAHHSFSAAGPPDQLRRDGVFGQSTTRILSTLPPGSNTGRYSAPRPEAPYHSSTTLSDTGSGSISASPISSASSSLAYSSFTPTAAVYSNQIPQISVANNFQAAPFAYPYNNPMSSIRRNSSIADASSSTMLPPNNPVSPSLGSAARDNYTTSTPGLLRHSHTLSPRLSDVSRYSSLPDTPRSVLSTAMSLPASSAYGSTGALGYTTSAQIPDSPPFNPQETFVEITCEGNPVQPNIEAKIEKGFFWSSDRVWTCYRRNYFAVTVSYTLSPWIPNGRLYITRSGKGPEQVQSMAVSLAAAVDNSNGKSVELIQHTPKRDRGPQLAIKKELLLPTPPGKTHETGSYSLTNFHQNTSVPGPQLPLQNEPEPSHSYSQAGHSSSTNYQHAFERIQFKCATANNGKRRAQQQYYHLIVELWANVQNPRDSQPEWVKVATKSSSHVVVRGRSPSHYQNEGPHNSHGSRGGAAGMGGSGHQGLGSNGGPTYGGSYGRLGLNGPSTMSGSTYRGTAYSLDPSPVGSHSVSSASSLSGGPVEGLVDQHMVDEEENKPLHAPEGYQYYPHTIYESLPAKLEGTGLPHPDRRVKDEYAGATAVPSGWSGGGCGRFQGMESSRGFYPDVHAHLGY